MNRKASQIGRSVWFEVVGASTRSHYNQKMKRLSNSILRQKESSHSEWIRNMKLEEYLARRLLSGTYADILEKISRYRELGVGHFILSFLGDAATEEIKEFASNVIPQL